MIYSAIEYFKTNSSVFFDELLNHIILLIALPLVLDIIIGVGLGILIYKYSRLKFILKLVSIIQILPSIVLLTLMILIGLGVGYKPAILALFIYGLLPIISDTYIGLNSIDNQYIIMSNALGLSPILKLIKVEIPLAASHIMSGIRLSALSISGLSVLANLVGAGGLGLFILTGIYQLQYHILLVGLIPSIIITWLIDIIMLRLIESTKLK